MQLHNSSNGATAAMDWLPSYVAEASCQKAKTIQASSICHHLRIPNQSWIGSTVNYLLSGSPSEQHIREKRDNATNGKIGSNPAAHRQMSLLVFSENDSNRATGKGV